MTNSITRRTDAKFDAWLEKIKEEYDKPKLAFMRDLEKRKQIIEGIVFDKGFEKIVCDNFKQRNME